MRHHRTASILVAGALLLPAGLGCGGGGGHAAAPPPPPAVAYDLVFDGVDAEGMRQLYRASLGGGAPQLLGLGYAGTRPNARPDGRAIVFASLPTDQVPSQLMLIEDLTRPAVPLSPVGTPAEREGVWSPDGRRLAFHSQLEDPDGDVFVAEVVGRSLANRRNLTPRGAGEPLISPDVTPAWSPDGTRLAFTSYRSGSPALWVMDADGGRLRQLTETSPQHGDYFPTWSPDGQWIAFQRISTTDSRIGLLPATGGPPGFFEFEGKAYSPAWSPDGAWIAFTGQVGGEYDIFVRAAAGTEIRRIPHPGEDHGPAWIRRVAP
jgi:TolB protein